MPLYQVRAPHFCVGVDVNPDGTVKAAAPIINWCIGKKWVYCEGYFIRKNYEIKLCQAQNDEQSSAISKPTGSTQRQSM